MGIVAEAGENRTSVQVDRPSWADMYKNYPKEEIKSVDFYEMVSKTWHRDALRDPENWGHTCAVRMSYALNHSGVVLGKPKSGAVIKGDDGYNYWMRVTDLSKFLEEKFKKGDEEYCPKPITSLTQSTIDARAQEVYTNFVQKILGRNGIVVFHVTGWTDATGHFTLWNGSYLLYVGDPEHNNQNSMEYYFWLMRPGPNNKVIQTSKVTFWELK